MTNTTTPNDANTTDSNEPTQLRHAQRRIRDAYFAHDSGLFALNCTPGSGKSVVATDVAAEELLERFVDGDPTPEQRICVISFNRDEAASIVPDVVARLRELVEHDLTPAAATVSEDELEYLIRRVRQAPAIGTIDSVFRDILSEFVRDVGFEEMPDVGNEAQLTSLHEDCYEKLTANPEYEVAIAVVEAAYPPDEYDDEPADLLQQALQHCRARRLSLKEFNADLHETVDAVYAEGKTASIHDISDALARCVGKEASAQACDSLTDEDCDQLVTADQQLYEAWIETVDAFCTLLAAYRDEYEALTRDRGVISHTACASLVTEFLTGELGSEGETGEKRERVLARYQSRIESVIIDEAQDVSTIQHAGLAPLVTEDCRVLCAGDLRQTIYVWRDAHPSIFKRAVEDSEYFGIDWDTHVTETATTTYRCVPDVAAAINAIAEPAFTDPNRGNIGDLDITYPSLNATRTATEDPNVHIAAFDTAAPPGSPEYIEPDSGKGEAGILATYIATGLADGTLGDVADTGTQPDVTVLFRWRTQMPRYARAFEGEGLTVANASDYLFDCPAVTAVLDVINWLVDPADPERLQTLVTDSPLGLTTLEPVFNSREWCLDAVREDQRIDLTEQHRDILDRLHQLREQRSAFHAQSAGVIVADVIETLALRADPNTIAASVTPSQRIANLDALTELVREWEGDTQYTLSELADLLDPFSEDPHTGPTQPVTNTDTNDVVFKTIHQAKGDEADVVALADLGWNLRKLGPTSQRFVATGPMVGLAPPTNAAAPDIDNLSVFSRGLYDPSDDDSRFGSTPYPLDVGLRWASEHWLDTATNDATRTGLVGHDHVQTATRITRAEAWRLLYTALTRARDHLILPLPRDIPGPNQPRDRWLETIRDGLQFDGTPQAGTYTVEVDTPDGSTRNIDVAVNDVDTFTGRSAGEPGADTETPFTATTSPDRNDLPPLVPRFLRPSTLYPLTEDPDRYLLDHLQNRPLHTETDAIDDELPVTLDTFDTETVGQFVHSVLTTAVERGVSATALRSTTDEVEDIIEAALQRHGPPATDAERDGLIELLTEFVIPEFITSELWSQLETAEEIYVEKPLRGHISRNDVEFELDGQADFVTRQPDGTWTITDTKIALTDMNPETRRRYQLQVTAYGALLAEEDGVEGPIIQSVEAFGAVTYRINSPWPHSLVERRVDALLEEGQ